MSELFLFVRPPRPLWPFNGEGSAFWPPLAFASLAAALRENVRNLRVAILDAPILRMGWNSLAAEIAQRKPAYVGIGEEAVSCVEGLRLARLAKQQGARVIAGGCFFGQAARGALSTGVIDVVVHGEGEQTIIEVVAALRSATANDLRRVRGISFREGEELVFTGHRAPLPDLDSLPMPAYDLLPMDAYGRESRNHPALASIELSRGCTHACEFCVLWRQMGSFNGHARPLLRTKSPERVLEEIQRLVGRHGRRYLGWVDPCFNAHPELPRRTAELMLSRGIRVGQSAWVRADHLLRDLRSGGFAASAASGLNELYLGVERIDNGELAAIHKGCTSDDIVHALRLLDREFPHVLTVGSFLYGLEGETPSDLRRFFRGAYSLPLDILLFIPLTPLPGTPEWHDQLWDGSGERFRYYDFLPRKNGNPHLLRLTKELYRNALLVWPAERIRRYIGGPFARDARRRSIVRRHTARMFKFIVKGVLTGGPTTSAMRLPNWYGN